MALMGLSYVCQKISVFHIQGTTFIKKIVNTFRRRINKFNDLKIISEVKIGNGTSQTFRCEQFFLMNEYLFKINLVNFFVCVIDTKLLKAIFLEHLEPINIEQFDFLQTAKFTQILSLINFIVQFLNNPQK